MANQELKQYTFNTVDWFIFVSKNVHKNILCVNIFVSYNAYENIFCRQGRSIVSLEYGIKLK